MDEKEGFTYTYSAPTEEERREIEAIRNRYMPMDERAKKNAELKRLNAKVQSGIKIAVVVYVAVGVLLFGAGLSLVMLNDVLSSGFIAGVVTGIIAIIMLAFTGMVYKKVKGYLHNKYGKKIFDLTSELLSKQ